MTVHARPFGPAILLAVAALGIGFGSAEARESASRPLQATLEILSPFTHEGDPLMVRLAVFNTGEQPYDNAAGINLMGGLRVTSASGSRLAMKGKEDPDPKKQPAVIAPGGFFGVIRDIAPLVPDVSKAGAYTLSWEGAGITAAPVTIKVLPRFDPEGSYVAVMETDYGYMEFALRTKQAPKHVKNFFDLAHFGFYDNTSIHQIIKGVELRGGDPEGNGAGGPGYTLDPEPAQGLKHKRGTLSAIRMQGRGQDNGSQFVITLGPREAYDGALTIFGEMTKGEDVLKAIENIPTTGQRDQPPYFRPLKPVVIRSVTVKTAAGASGGAGR